MTTRLVAQRSCAKSLAIRVIPTYQAGVYVLRARHHISTQVLVLLALKQRILQVNQGPRPYASGILGTASHVHVRHGLFNRSPGWPIEAMRSLYDLLRAKRSL
jgi:hypothetical protein